MLDPYTAKLAAEPQEHLETVEGSGPEQLPRLFHNSPMGRDLLLGDVDQFCLVGKDAQMNLLLVIQRDAGGVPAGKYR